MTRPVIELSKQVTEARYFSFRRQGGRLRTPVDVIFGGREHCSPEYAINRKGFPVYLLEYVEEGSGELVLQGQRYPLRRGCLYLYGPGVPCRILNNRERPLVKLFIAFQCKGPSLQRQYQLDRLFFGANRGGEQVSDSVQQLFEEGCIASEDSWRICCYYLDIILLKCARTRLVEQQFRERAWKVFRDIKVHIEDNYLELDRMDDIAEAVELDASYISRLFKRYYHMTPYTFLQQKKMEHALDLLRQGNVSVRDAAAAVGLRTRSISHGSSRSSRASARASRGSRSRDEGSGFAFSFAGQARDQARVEWSRGSPDPRKVSGSGDPLLL